MGNGGHLDLIAGGWRVLAASVAGASHVARGEPCQDAHAAAAGPDGALALAIADGAGSAPQGALGASLAVKAAVAALEGGANTDGRAGERADHGAWRPAGAGLGGAVGAAGLASRVRAAALAARAAVVDEAVDRGLPLRDLACTLTIALAEDDGAAALQVGDGLAVLRVAKDYASGLLLAVDPARGEHANQTTFLTSDGALVGQRVGARGGRRLAGLVGLAPDAAAGAAGWLAASIAG